MAPWDLSRVVTVALQARFSDFNGLKEPRELQESPQIGGFHSAQETAGRCVLMYLQALCSLSSPTQVTPL